MKLASAIFHFAYESTINRFFSKKYKNQVVEWEGQVLRVDGDHYEDDNDSTTLINSEKRHYYTHGAVEIFMRMTPTLS